MTILLIAEHDNKNLSECLGKAITAGQKLNQDIHVLVAGHNCQSVAEQAAKYPVAKVIHADNACYEHFIAENMTGLVMSLAGDYDYIAAASTTTSRNYMPCVATLCDTNLIADVIDVVSEDTFKRPAYAGNAILTLQILTAKKILTIRATAFDAQSASGDGAAIESNDTVCCSDKVTFNKMEASASERPELTSAKVVVSGGRALKDSENFKIIDQLADKLGAAVGASRAAVDAGFVPNDYQVGQTGKIVAPELYIAVGISGAIQHLAGMKDSKVIVAINKDPECPMFQMADYALEGDLFKLVPELTEKL